jgi:hypothetical protein
MCSVVENVRSIETVLNQILDIVPENFSKKPELRVRLNYVIDDSKYRSPELMCIAWQDATLVLRDILIPEALASKTWNWADDVFELFSDGKWSKAVNKEKSMAC